MILVSKQKNTPKETDDRTEMEKLMDERVEKEAGFELKDLPRLEKEWEKEEEEEIKFNSQFKFPPEIETQISQWRMEENQKIQQNPEIARREFSKSNFPPGRYQKMPIIFRFGEGY